MVLQKCPRCELNYIREDEKYCNVCRREIKGEKDDTEELQNLCMECGENNALKGQELCAYCLGEKRRREKLETLMEQPTAELDVELTQLDEIDVPTNADIPSEDLQEIHKEFADEDDELEGDEERYGGEFEEADDFDDEFNDEIEDELDDDLDDEE